VDDRTQELARRREAARHAGSERAVAAQRGKGKLTARERLDCLLDEGSFQELDMLARHHGGDAGPDGAPYTDGVVTGFGTIDGRRVCVYSQDFTVVGGSLGEVAGGKIHKVMDLAAATGVPVIGLNDSGGARIQEGVVSLAMYGGIFARNVACSGVVPQVSVILGPCAGGAVYSPAMTDFVFMVRDSSHMFITGPEVVRAVTGEEVSVEELGGAATHATRSGVCTFVADDEKSGLDQVRQLLSYLPANHAEAPPRAAGEGPGADHRRPALAEVLPEHPSHPYDVRQVVEAVVDGGVLLEYCERWARSIVCALARIDGRPVGVVANQPAVLAGVVDIESSEKAARFVRTCDAFNLPLVTFVDVPGFLPGTDQEHGGIVRNGAKLLYAFCEAQVPRLQVVTRKAYGGAAVVMNSKATGCDLSFAWPTAEFAVMGAQGAVEVLHRRELAEAADRPALEVALADAYRASHLNPWLAAERGYVDEVIDPADTRAVLVRGLDMLATKGRRRRPRKHGNVPL